MENELYHDQIKEIAHKYGPDVVYYMASTGTMTSDCLEKGCLPVPVHFYQPIPDLKDLDERGVWDRVSPLSGIEWDTEKYTENLKILSQYADECNWPNEPSEDPAAFHINNTAFSYGCASALHCIIRKYKPKRVIEVGSGNSSKVIAGALKVNVDEDSGYKPEYTIIDPYSGLDTDIFPIETTLYRQQVETMDLEFFAQLEAGDILFIDSSHVCRTGSDVNYEILDILPNLNTGVLIHFHDISLPHEYPKVYSTSRTPIFWTENYLLQAFLIENSNFEVFLPMDYMQRNHEPLFRSLFPKGNQAVLWGSGSFWIRRKYDPQHQGRIQRQLLEAQTQIESLTNTVNAYEQSTSWRVTSPLRRLKKIFSK